MAILTDADKQILPLALRQNNGFHIACKWYLREMEPLWYQYAFHQATQGNVTMLAGIAAGKSFGVAASYMIDCMTIPYFRALNTAPTAKQAEIPFEMVMAWIDENERVNRFIDDIALRPYPLIKFINNSEWVFRTAGKGARFIRGLEYDRANYDEAGLDFDGEVVKILRGRLRGVRVDGSQRMARLDVITSPSDAPWLRERFDRGDRDNPDADLSTHLSIRVPTWANTRLAPEQIELMKLEYTDEMIDVEMGANFPDYGVSMFPKSHVAACSDQSLYDAIELALRPETGRPKAGYLVNEHPRYGVIKYEIPPVPDGLYIMAGDPGTDGPPRRNAGVVMVAEISRRPSNVVYFDWVNGMGSYTPFLQSYKYAIQRYRPVLKGLDTTGTQKAINELAFENMGIEVDGINFQRDKNAMLNSLSLAVTNHELCWLPAKGIMRQMFSYSRETDDKKLPQDIVMTLAELAFLMRYTPEQDNSNVPASRGNLKDRRLRSSGRRR